jgi:CRISPR-associated protein Csb1
VHADGATDTLSTDRKAVRYVYQEAFEAARTAGFNLSSEPLRLVPQDKLVEIVRRSQELALSGAGGEEDDSGEDK